MNQLTTEAYRAVQADVAARRAIRNQIENWIAMVVAPVTQDYGTCCKLVVKHSNNEIFTLNIRKPPSDLELMDGLITEVVGAALRDASAMRSGTQLYQISAHYTDNDRYTPDMLFHAAPPRLHDEKPEAQIGIHESFGGDDSYFLSLDIEMHGSRESCFQVKEKLESLIRDVCVAPAEPIDR